MAVQAQTASSGTVRKDELKEVLINLVENARGAGAGEVVIQTGRNPRGRVLLTVRDNGSGIRAEDLQRIFERSSLPPRVEPVWGWQFVSAWWNLGAVPFRSKARSAWGHP